MRFSVSSFVLAMLLAGSLLLPQHAVAADQLRIGGTGSSIGMLGKVGAKFTAATGTGVRVIPGLGSSGSIRALTDGKLDIAVSARPVKPAELAAGVRQVMMVRTGFVLATSYPKPKGFKVADLPGIYMADKPVWTDGAPIRLILRPRSETDTKLLGKLAAGMDEAIEALRLRAEVPIAATDQDNADMAERQKGSLTGTTLTQLKTEDRRLNLVPLDGVEPTFANFESGRYPFEKKLYFILRPNDVPAASQFIDFMRSPKGLAALREAEVLLGAE